MDNSGESRRLTDFSRVLSAFTAFGLVMAALAWFDGAKVFAGMLLAISVTTACLAVATAALRATRRLVPPPPLRPHLAVFLLNRVLAVESEQVRRLGGELSPPFDLMPAEADPMSGEVSVALADAYERLHRNRLVLTGAPGSGKTASARRLVIELAGRAKRRTSDDVRVLVPALAALSSWNPASEGVEDWFTAHLDDRYGFRPGTVRSLVRNRQVLPVLDGLDELPASQRATAVPLLSRWLDSFDGYVLTCRSSAFPELEPLLRIPPHGLTVELGPLRNDTVAAHLRQAGAQRWRPVAEAVQAEPDGPLAQALSSPWLLSLAVNGYPVLGHRDPAELADRARLPDAAAIRRRILDTADPTASIEGWGPTGRRRLELLTDAMGREHDGLLLWWRLAERYGSASARRYLRTALVWLPALVVVAVGGAPGHLFVALFVVMGTMGALSPMSTKQLPRRLGRPRRPTSSADTRVVDRLLALLPTTVLSGVSFLGFSTYGSGFSLHFSDAPVTMSAALAACLLAGLVLALTGQGAEPRQVRRAGDLRADLWASLAQSAAIAFLLCLPLSGFASDAVTGGARLPSPVWVAAVASVFGSALSSSVWGAYRLAHLGLVLKGELPLRLRRFLAEAQQHGLLVPADGYGTGCYAFRHDLVRRALLTRGTGRLEHVRATERIRNEIRDEVLTRPESVSYLAYASDGAPETSASESRRIAWLTDEVLAKDLRTVADQGFETYRRYQEARERLGAAVPTPRWAVPRLAQFYGTTTVVAGGFVCSALLLLVGLHPDLWLPLSLAGAPALLVAALVIHAQWRTTGAKGAFALPLLWLLALWLLDPLVPARQLPTVALASAALAVLALLAWLYARPHTTRTRAVLSDNPATWPDVPAASSRHREAALQARQDWVTALARDGVMPLIRGRLRVREDAGTAPALPAIDPSRLTGARRTDQFVGTEAADEIAFHLDALGSGSIGISGQRGAGKSSLMQRFCTPGPTSNADDLLVLVPAPTSYDPREFLIHLFAEVCRKLTGDGPADDGHPGPAAGRHRSLAHHTGAALTVLTGIVVLVVTLLKPQLATAARTVTEHAHDLLIAGGVLLLVTGVAWELLLPLRAARRTGIRSGSAEAAAAAHLRTLHYQLTVMRTRNAQLALPAGLQVADGSQVQHTQQVLTHPELVARFRALLDLAARERRALGGRVVIGIDELDKLGSAEEAERFLNDLKAVFGVRDCHFLVAVSEDALTAFGRQALDVRTTFDSAFDRVVAVRPLDLGQARRLLELRGVWLPEPYLWLCQILSGGLPRELLRSVMSLATHRALRHTTDMRALMSRLIEDDARSVLSAQTRYATTLAGAGAPAAARWIADASQAPVTAADWAAVSLDAPSVDPDEYETARAVTQVRAFLSLGIVLMRTFTEGADHEITPRLTRLRASGPAPVDHLATARAKLAAEPEAAWAAVARYRTEVLGLRPT